MKYSTYPIHSYCILVRIRLYRPELLIALTALKSNQWYLHLRPNVLRGKERLRRYVVKRGPQSLETALFFDYQNFESIHQSLQESILLAPIDVCTSLALSSLVPQLKPCRSLPPPGVSRAYLIPWGSTCHCQPRQVLLLSPQFSRPQPLRQRVPQSMAKMSPRARARSIMVRA